ncbi:MAG: signal peptidase I [Armatimonadota bacterium]
MTRQRRLLALGVVAAAIYGFGNLFSPTVVLGESMKPTLDNGQVLLVDRLYYQTHKPQRGEVVVFRLGGETYIKRVYRGPGEKLSYLEVGGEWLAAIRENREDEMRRRYEGGISAIRVCETTIPEDSVFVVGDNIHNSEDSRTFGPIPISAILGRANLEVDRTKALVYETVPTVRRPVAAHHAAPEKPEPDHALQQHSRGPVAHPHPEAVRAMVASAS